MSPSGRAEERDTGFESSPTPGTREIVGGGSAPTSCEPDATSRTHVAAEPVDRPVDRSPEASDDVEAALVAALRVATAATDLDAIRAVTEELRARRLARAGNVVELDDAARRRRGR